ncbi:MAG: lysophospholipid acyltransferase family protein [Gemmatimonadetes bacterium]|nr:lysophospholipid acyltransferase family protein [Gemmatimonadota bacterium]
MLLPAIQGLARALPLSIGYRIADLSADLHRTCARNRRAALAENLRILTGGPDPAAERRAFRHYSRFVFELLRGPDVPEAGFRFEGLERLEAARAAGRGAILAVPHTGNWLIGGARLARLGHPVVAVAGVQLASAWTDRIRAQQRAQGIEIVSSGVAGGRALRRALAANSVVALLADGDVYRGGHPVDFAGRRVILPEGPARLAQRTGAPLFPAFAFRLADGSFRCEIRPEIPVRAGEEGVRNATAEIGRTLETILSEDPAQWLLFRRFFAPTAHETAAARTGGAAPSRGAAAERRAPVLGRAS